MRNSATTTALELVKDTTTALIKLLWNAFKACLSAVFVLLAWFAAWGVWEKGALSFGTVGVIAFLVFLAVAPWVIPRMSLPDKPAPRTIAICGAIVAFVCVDLAYSALTYGWKGDQCTAPGVLFCHAMNLLHRLGGNALIAVTWLGAAALIARGTVKAVTRAAEIERAHQNAAAASR